MRYKPPERHLNFREPRRTSVTDDSGKKIAAYVAECDECLAIDHVRITTHASSIPPDMLRKKFTQRGWSLEKRATRCPNCQRKPVMEKPVTLKVVETPHAQPPRTMTRDERRAITRQIDDNWDEKASRYAGTTTDAGIASALNVPRAWVETIRVETFGDSGANEDIDKLMIELSAMRDRAGTTLDQAVEWAARVETLQKDIGELERKLMRLTKK